MGKFTGESGQGNQSMSDVDPLIIAVTQLPESDRVRVVEALLDSLDVANTDSPQEVSESWRNEVRRRSEELRKGEVVAVPREEVRAEGERLLGGGN